jgi:NADPH-dependent 2,4-dienoyl-CoA reductase/sulfur reductase-like enzyme
MNGHGVVQAVTITASFSFCLGMRKPVRYLSSIKTAEKKRFYDDLKITPVLGDRVSGIDVDGRRLDIKNSVTIPYDKLLIATGADARPVKAEGTNLKNIFLHANRSPRPAHA